jgi:hypothetical protein
VASGICRSGINFREGDAPGPVVLGHKDGFGSDCNKVAWTLTVKSKTSNGCSNNLLFSEISAELFPRAGERTMNWPAFTNPLLLAGLAAVGLPLLIHWLTRARPRRIAFPPFKFLVEACAGQQAVNRLRTILLLAIRCLLVLALALALLALAALRRWRERRGGAALVLRAVIVGALVLVMLNPQWLFSRQRTEKPKLVVLLDSSAGMATRDVGGESRYVAALKVLGNASTLAKLNQEFVLDFRQFDRASRPAELMQLMSNAPAGEATEIGKSLMSAVSELGDTKAQAGVLLVSDGRATAPDTLDAAQLALARSVPLWTWTVGGPSGIPD